MKYIQIILFITFCKNISFAQTSFINTIMINGNVQTEYCKAAAFHNGYIYTTGTINGVIMINRYDAQTMQIDATWNVDWLNSIAIQNLSFSTNGAVGFDIEIYENYAWLLCKGTSVYNLAIHLFKIDISTNTDNVVAYAVIESNAPIALFGNALSVNDGGVTIIGEFDVDAWLSNLPVIDDNNNINSEANLFLAKVSTKATIDPYTLDPLWIVYIPSSHDAAGYGITTNIEIQDPYSTYITGYFASSEASLPANPQTIDFPGLSTLTSTGGNEIFIAKYRDDLSGNPPAFEWSEQAGSATPQIRVHSYQNEVGYDITVDGSDAVYVTGKARGDQNLSAVFGNQFVQCTNSVDFGFIAKYKNNGVCVWVKRMGDCPTNSPSPGFAVAVGRHVYVAGRSDYPSFQGYAAFIGGYDLSNGNIIFESSSYNLSNNIESSALSITATKCNLYVGGYFMGNVKFGMEDGQVLSSSSSTDKAAFLSKLSSFGNVNFNTGSNYFDCMPGTTEICATGGVFYLWSPGNQNTSCITAISTSATNFAVEIGDGGCTSRIPITFHPAWNADAGNNVNLNCPGPCAQIGTSHPGSPAIIWNDAATQSPRTVCSPNYGIYTLTVAYPGCPATNDQVNAESGDPCKIHQNMINSLK